jgi:hypothetical protein
VRRRKNFLDPHALHAAAKLFAIHLVTVAQEVGRRGVVGERSDDLLGGPGGGRMFGDVEVDDAPAVMGEHDEYEEDPQASGGNGEEIDRNKVLDVVGEERAPGLRRGRAPLGDQPRPCARLLQFRASAVRHGFGERPIADWQRPFFG